MVANPTSHLSSGMMCESSPRYAKSCHTNSTQEDTIAAEEAPLVDGRNHMLKHSMKALESHLGKPWQVASRR